METTLPRTNSVLCNCDHYAPPLRVLRSVDFNMKLAQFYVTLGLSGDGTLDWVLTQLFDHRTGGLFGFDRRPIAIDTDPALTDNVFTIDERRFINRYRDRANSQFRYRLQEHLVFPVLLMHFAREIHVCRTGGHCARLG